MESKSRAFKEHGVQNWTFFLDVVKGAREPGNLLPLLRRKAVEVDLEHKFFFLSCIRFFFVGFTSETRLHFLNFLDFSFFIDVVMVKELLC